MTHSAGVPRRAASDAAGSQAIRILGVDEVIAVVILTVVADLGLALADVGNAVPVFVGLTGGDVLVVGDTVAVTVDLTCIGHSVVVARVIPDHAVAVGIRRIDVTFVGNRVLVAVGCLDTCVDDEIR